VEVGRAEEGKIDVSGSESDEEEEDSEEEDESPSLELASAPLVVFGCQ